MSTLQWFCRALEFLGRIGLVLVLGLGLVLGYMSPVDM